MRYAQIFLFVACGLLLSIIKSCKSQHALSTSSSACEIEIRLYDHEYPLESIMEYLERQYPDIHIRFANLDFSLFKVSLVDASVAIKTRLYPGLKEDPKMRSRMPGLIKRNPQLLEGSEWVILNEEDADRLNKKVGDVVTLEFKTDSHQATRKVSLVVIGIMPSWFDDFSKEYAFVHPDLYRSIQLNALGWPVRSRKWSGHQTARKPTVYYDGFRAYVDEVSELKSIKLKAEKLSHHGVRYDDHMEILCQHLIVREKTKQRWYYLLLLITAIAFIKTLTSEEDGAYL